jgi:hypothetical protein
VKDKPRNLVASVRDRLLQLAQKQNETFQSLLTRYCLERLLYRLSQSPHRETFILKGALLFALWSDQPHRPTRDVDLLGRGENSVERLEQVFREICAHPVEDDGLTILAETVRAERIRADEEYEGVRVRCEAHLGNARIGVQADIGFGDVVTPAVAVVTYPTLLRFPAPVLLAYPQETVISEKFQAMVLLGIGNSRMKDFYDVWVMARQFVFQGPTLSRAIRATFQRRQTAVPGEPPLALSAAFHTDRDKQQQWQAFVRKGKLASARVELEQVVTVLRDFLMPPAQAVCKGDPFDMTWPASGPWQRAVP